MTEDEARAMVEQHLADQARQQRERTEAAKSGPVHIRKKIARKRGDGFYRVQYSASENGSQTLCGAPAGNDRTWAETRFAKHLATVTCDTCKQIRTTA
ncbi:hypothetical protein [Streptacidiphilus carbonis]|uniref:hypothetical protein n=1 Tax=Streptacidiphilus carbonis TaxID=105422 RepID=UPI0005A68B25|nr:hypothetical protein [Streptacidiphilus carbonis]